MSLQLAGITCRIVRKGLVHVIGPLEPGSDFCPGSLDVTTLSVLFFLETVHYDENPLLS